MIHRFSIAKHCGIIEPISWHKSDDSVKSSFSSVFFFNCLPDTYVKFAIHNIISPTKTWILHFDKCIFEPAKQINQVKVLPRHSFKSDRGFYLPGFLRLPPHLISVDCTFINFLRFEPIFAGELDQLLPKHRTDCKSRLSLQTYFIPSVQLKKAGMRKKSKKSPKAIAVFKIFVL